ncbi:hypothetical protein D9757_003034 [Collybiopsis confluens]|uniref:Uncharacterized protein n=1 Tax=Collybiopsis confluens TaxID=2823264 RepID=A0A8H5HXN4_9AGAR|nr:hypothetical protein D9757_003034 [Collybiopsis confluens]
MESKEKTYKSREILSRRSQAKRPSYTASKYFTSYTQAPMRAVQFILSTLLLGVLSSTSSAAPSPQISSNCSTDADCPSGEVCRIFVLVLGEPILHCLPPLTTTSPAVAPTNN